MWRSYAVDDKGLGYSLPLCIQNTWDDLDMMSFLPPLSSMYTM